MVIQSFTFLTHSISLDSLEVSSGFVDIYSVISITIETNPVISNNITKGQHVYENSRGPRTDPCGTPYFTVDNLDVSPFK